MTAERRAPRARGSRKRAGFALLAVIWGVGVISLLVVSFMSTGRLRLQTAYNIANAAQAAYIAEGVVNSIAMTLLGEHNAAGAQLESPVRDGAPLYCVFDGAAIAVAVEDESGKVDLNAASPELLRAMLTGFGLDPRAAESTVNAIMVFRSAPTDDRLQARMGSETSDKPIAPKRSSFDTVLELDQVGGIDPALFRDLVPYVTVHSRSPGIDGRASPPALFAALAGYPLAEVRALMATPYPNRIKRDDPRLPATLRQQGDRSAFLVHVEALLATGQTASKDAIVELRPTPGGPFGVRELRRGQSRYVDRLRSMIATNGAGVPDC